MTFPQNEAETIELYKLCQRRLGWRITHLQIAFPDAVIENKRGQQLIAEFEFKSKNFRQHGHDPNECDIIIAYRNDWENPPVPVWALEDCAKEEALIVSKILGLTVPAQSYFDLCKKLQRSDAKTRRLEGELRRTKDSMVLQPGKINETQNTYSIAQERTDKSDWLLMLSSVALGIGLWASLPIVLKIIGS